MSESDADNAPPVEADAVPADSAKADPSKADPVKTLELKPYVIEALSTVYDPEIPVNIYKLDLVYDIVIDAQGVVHIAMTLTSPACPSAQQIPVDVANKVRAIAGVTDADVQIVWDPPWTMDKMSDAAKMQLGIGW